MSEAGDEKTEGPLKKYHVEKSFADRRYKVSSARTYFYLNEASCERNMDIFIRCLEAVAGELQKISKLKNIRKFVRIFRKYSLGKIESCHSAVIVATTAITHVIHLNLLSAYRQRKEVACVHACVYPLLHICLDVYPITYKFFRFCFLTYT